MSEDTKKYYNYMNSLKLLVSVYKLGLECGVFTIEDIIKFCDIIIENLENPPFEIIEASLMSHSNVEELAFSR